MKIETIRQRLLPPILFLICLCGIILCRVFFPALWLLPTAVTLLGVLLVLFGIGLLILGSTLFRRLKTNINTFLIPERLVAEGVFKLSRNPMYLGFILVLLGLSVSLPSFGSLVICLVFFTVCNLWYIPFEEVMCQQQFGEHYRKYTQRVRRWL